MKPRRYDRSILFIIGLILNLIYLKTQAQANYQYDAQGRLTTDLIHGIVKIEWNNLNRIVAIIRADTSHLPDVLFAYDLKGNRVRKLVIPRDGAGRKAQPEWRYTHYVNDAAGNVQAIYEGEYKSLSTPDEYEEYFTLKDNIIHHSQPIGYRSIDKTLVTQQFSATIKPDGQFATIENETSSNSTDTGPVASSYRGKKIYSLSNHIGSVLVSIRDRSIINNGFLFRSADVNSASDYYPFGMPMPARTFNHAAYRFGFSSEEADNELMGVGNSYDFGSRMYDPRIGRWYSMDPLAHTYGMISPYAFTLNNPIRYVDPDGEDVINGGFQVINKSTQPVIVGYWLTEERKQEIMKYWMDRGMKYKDAYEASGRGQAQVILMPGQQIKVTKNADGTDLQASVVQFAELKNGKLVKLKSERFVKDLEQYDMDYIKMLPGQKFIDDDGEVRTIDNTLPYAAKDENMRIKLRSSWFMAGRAHGWTKPDLGKAIRGKVIISGNADALKTEVEGPTFYTPKVLFGDKLPEEPKSEGMGGAGQQSQDEGQRGRKSN